MREDHDAFVHSKRTARMERVDNLAPEHRELVHEYGLSVVQAFLQNGLTKPKQIRHLINTVLDELNPLRGSFSAQGVRTPRKEIP